jgi:hypothetical protein
MCELGNLYRSVEIGVAEVIVQIRELRASNCIEALHPRMHSSSSNPPSLPFLPSDPPAPQKKLLPPFLPLNSLPSQPPNPLHSRLLHLLIRSIQLHHSRNTNSAAAAKVLHQCRGCKALSASVAASGPVWQAATQGQQQLQHCSGIIWTRRAPRRLSHTGRIEHPGRLPYCAGYPVSGGPSPVDSHSSSRLCSPLLASARLASK